MDIIKQHYHFNMRQPINCDAIEIELKSSHFLFSIQTIIMNLGKKLALTYNLFLPWLITHR